MDSIFVIGSSIKLILSPRNAPCFSAPPRMFEEKNRAGGVHDGVCLQNLISCSEGLTCLLTHFPSWSRDSLDTGVAVGRSVGYPSAPPLPSLCCFVYWFSPNKECFKVRDNCKVRLSENPSVCVHGIDWVRECAPKPWVQPVLIVWQVGFLKRSHWEHLDLGITVAAFGTA